MRPYLKDTDCREWPTFAEAFLLGQQTSNAINAWDSVIRVLQIFRQGVDVGRNPGSSPQQPGRSRWPEPESIRRITGRRCSRHSRIPDIPDDAFPRAELGLPIVFHFKDRDDPPDTVLYPGGGPEGQRERMASPLILKAVALQNDQFVPAIVRLKTPPLTAVDLRKDHQSPPLPRTSRIRDPQLANYPKSPLQGRATSGSAIEGFLAYAQSQGFEEVR